MMNSHSLRGARRLRPAARGAAVLAAAGVLALAACSTKEILTVEDPDVASPGTIENKEALPSIRAGAIASFGNALNGNTTEGQISLAGLLTDEYINTETFPTRIEIDNRHQQINNSTLAALFYDLQAARVAADRAAEAYKKFDPANKAYAEVLALGGLSLVLLAEDYCGSVPLSSLDVTTGIVNYGTPLSTAQLLDSAVSKFNQALAIDSTSNLAKVGKGRALLDQGKFAEAAAAVASVPTTFQYLYQHSTTTTRQNNATWALTVSVARFGVANREGGNGLPFQSEGNAKNAGFDPRVADTVRFSSSNPRGTGFDGSTVQWIQMRYPTRSSPTVVADGVEARLIEAEAALRAGNATGALTILNALRSNSALLALRGYPAGSLPPLTLAGTSAAQVDQLFKERAYWLFLTAHRLGDMRRLIKQYARAPETVFPTGAYFKGGTYGTDVNSPIPQAEQNNPQFNPASCKTTEA